MRELALVPWTSEVKVASDDAVVAIGITGTNVEATVRFANRLLGRCAFRASEIAQGVDVRTYFDDERHLGVVLGLNRGNELMDMTQYELQQAKLMLYLMTCCHLVYIVKDDGRINSTMTTKYRILSNAKYHLMQYIKQYMKNTKNGMFNAYTPGKIVPIVSFVCPLPTEINMRSNKGRSTMMAFCKAMETRIQATIKPLRSNTTSIVRAKDHLNQINTTGKDRRLFVLDPNHTVVAVSRKVACCDLNLLERMAFVIDRVDIGNGTTKQKQLFQLLDDEDTIGVPHTIQYVSKFIDFMLQIGGDDNVLTMNSWLRHAQLIARWLFVDNVIFAPPTELMSDIDARDSTPLTFFESLDIVGTFAKDMCAREFPPAIKRYLSERPEACTSSGHKYRVEKTIQEFKRSVGYTNPLISEFIDRIEASCKEIWINGRRLCDNRPCLSLIEKDEDIESHKHLSGVYISVACQCGLSRFRAPDAFSAESNNESQWQMSCCLSHDTLSSASNTSLLWLGDCSLYKPNEGFYTLMDGFISKFGCLSPWYREASGIGTKRMKKNPKAHDNELVAFAGMEYECCMGHRFFFSTSTTSPQDNIWPGCDMAIYVQCFQCAVSKQADKAAEHAQLRRVYIVTPPVQTKSLNLHLSIKMEDTDQVIYIFDYAGLPHSSTICCCLPYVFTTEQTCFHHGAALKLHSQILSLQG
ncbi:hypothetical protein THRCLA_10585 [Thraustotheca clavata]|uniref:Nonsense-mediated mRNA decay factor SMG8 n=1 Tax=Thraustotheca clavata TaxID=74557 RepID=A0A1V9YK00_9STRA|nr:hypothetical protein THRCLA_10585 [Thraustotheca clavata]